MALPLQMFRCHQCYEPFSRAVPTQRTDSSMHAHAHSRCTRYAVCRSAQACWRSVEADKVSNEDRANALTGLRPHFYRTRIVAPPIRSRHKRRKGSWSHWCEHSEAPRYQLVQSARGFRPELYVALALARTTPL
jgi:hypothetical protein